MAGISMQGRARRQRGMAAAAVACALAMGAVSCSSSGGSSGDASATTAAPTTTASGASTTTTAEATTTTTAPAEVKVGPAFYQDGFTDNSKGWPTTDDANVTETVQSTYATPLYSIVVHTATTAETPHPEFRSITQAQLRDYAITAEVQTTLKVSSKDHFGVTCRDLHGSRYQFTITQPVSQGDPANWAIDKYDGSAYVNQGHGTFTAGGSAFEITGACTGGHDGAPAHLVLMVNGEKVGEATDADSPLEEGYGGVYVDSNDGGSAYNVLGFKASTVTS